MANPLQQLTGGSGFSLEDITGQPDDGAGGEPVPQDYDKSQFDVFGGTVQANKDIELATKRVDADTKMRWGYGSAKNPENQGYLYIDLYNDATTPAQVEGTIKFYIESPTRRKSFFVKSYDTTRLDASKSDRTSMVPFPLQAKYIATEDSWLVIYFNSNVDDTVAKANSEVIIPVTEYDLG